jgi:predicted Zn-dependent protease
MNQLLKHSVPVTILLTILLLPGLYAQTSMEERIGEATLSSVERSYGFYENQELLDYVESIGKKLEAQLPDNPYDFKYYLVDTPEPNAFATAGGYVFVNRGIFPVIDTEDELAGVLGHEFTHVLHRHSTKKMYRNIVPAILEIPGNLLGKVFPEYVGNLINMPIDLTARTTDAAFSRKQENNADTYGIQFATRAGYDPAGLKSALLKLEEYVQDRYNVEEHFTIFLDHPLTDDRARHLDMLMEQYAMQSVEPTPMAHHMDGIIVGQNPEQGVIYPDHSFSHPGLDLHIQFPAEWKIDNTPVALTATDQSGITGFVVGVEEHATRIDSAALKMASILKEGGFDAVVGDPYLLNGLEAIDLMVEGEDIRREGKSQFTWIGLEEQGLILHCMGTAHTDDNFREIQHTISSIRRLEPDDRKKIVSHLLYVEEGGDETLEEFARRMGSSVIHSLELTAIINRLDPSDPVLGKQIKFIRAVPYFSD